MAHTFFFDIETGGFSGQNNPILSISWAHNKQKVESRYVNLAPGHQISRWSENKIWQPIVEQGVTLQKEKTVLGEFLGQLEKLDPRSRLVGWNIGYVAAAQSRTSAAGFDIQMVIERARQLGMEERATKAFRKHQIVDLGSEWALKIARGLTTDGVGERLVKEGVLHESLLQQAQGFVKKGSEYASRYGLQNDVQIAEALSRNNRWFTGWKQELVYEVIMGKPLEAAHASDVDVRALRQIMKSGGEVNEGFLRKWAPMALRNKLVGQAKFVPEVASEMVPARFQSVMAEARTWGMAPQVEGALRQTALLSGVEFSEVQAGKGIRQISRTIRGAGIADELSRAGAPQLSRLIDDVTPFLKSNWGKLAIGGGLAAAFILEPGSLFSGKDDAYNVIEGLPHGGLAQRMRLDMTDFGSGYQGTKDEGIGFVDVLEGINSTAFTSMGALTGFDRFGKIGAIVGGATAIGLLSAGKFLNFDEKEAEGNLGKTLWNIGLQGVVASGSVSMFASSTMKGSLLGNLMESNPKMNQVLEHFYKTYSNAGFGSMEMFRAGGFGSLQSVSMESFAKKIAPKGFKDIAGKLMASSQGSPYVLESVMKHGSIQDVPVREFFKSNLKDLGTGSVAGFTLGAPVGTLTWAFSGKDDAYNTIEGLPHGGSAEKMRKSMTDFGSGWDTMRSLVRSGETFEQMIKSKDFVEALAGATKGKLLGKPSNYGKAWSMTSQLFRGKTFKFVRKEGLIGRHEMKALEHMQATKGPSVYASNIETIQSGQFTSTGTIDMEMFEGTAFADLSKDRLKTIADDMPDHLKTLHQKYVHGDLHLNNLILTKDAKGKSQVGVIDFGLARPRPASKSRQKEWAGEIERELDKTRTIFTGHIVGPFARSKSLPMVMDTGSIPFASPSDVYAIPELNKPIEAVSGLHHSGGMAQATRAKNTGFGSPWLRKALSLGIGQKTIAEAARRSGKELVKTATGESFMVGRLIGKGGFGEVRSVKSLASGQGGVYKTAVKGMENPKFLQKDSSSVILGRAVSSMPEKYATGEVSESVFFKHLGFAETATSAIRKEFIAGGYKTHLGYEAAMQTMARKELGSVVPKVLGTTDKGFIQEFAGREIKKGAETEAAGKFLKEQFAPMVGMNRKVSHFDPDVANLLIDKNGNFKMIDWGTAAPTDALSRTPELKEGYGALVNEALKRANVSPISKEVLSRGVPQGASVEAVKKAAKGGNAAEAAAMMASKAPVGMPGGPVNIDTITKEIPTPPKTSIIPGTPTRIVGTGKPDPVDLTATRTISSSGTMSGIIKKGGDFGSPVNLDKASSGDVSKQPMVVSRGNRSIMEPQNQKRRRKATLQAKHMQSQVRSSKNSLRPGKRHRQAAGRIVI